jgi:hypothetical protein
MEFCDRGLQCSINGTDHCFGGRVGDLGQGPLAATPRESRLPNLHFTDNDTDSLLQAEA